MAPHMRTFRNPRAATPAQTQTTHGKHLMGARLLSCRM
jgi:hypothetical protein